MKWTTTSGNTAGGRKEIEQMLADFADTFRQYYDPTDHSSPAEVVQYGYYYMGSIICTNETTRKIIDGQQRLTSLTLLFIYLRNLQAQLSGVDYLPVNIDRLIYRDDYGAMVFNLDVPERNACMQALWERKEG